MVLSLTWMQIHLEDSKLFWFFVFLNYGQLHAFFTDFRVCLWVCEIVSIYIVFAATEKSLCRLLLQQVYPSFPV